MTYSQPRDVPHSEDYERGWKAACAARRAAVGALPAGFTRLDAAAALTPTPPDRIYPPGQPFPQVDGLTLQAVIAGSEKVAPSWDWTPMGRIQFSAPDGWIEIRAGGDLGKRLTDAMAAGGAYRLTLVRPDPPPDYISGWQRASDDAWRAMGSLPDPITVDALNGILFRLAGEIDP